MLAETPPSAIPQIQLEPRVSRSEAASSKRLVRMVPGSARNWIAVNGSSTIQPQQKMKTTKKESYMENPRKRTTVATAAGEDGLHLFDHQQQQAYALNTTSALVWQHCDGQTTPEQLMELLRQNFNVPRVQAEQLTWLALDELGK